ncbi:HAMP domain-containing sensor histidine kinase [Aestuariivita sp.]|jgi:signal transduction histidine kinase|uniref:sensor histidine kinase n=1 Tax=Aestuariivita sp. TaxID=1872407 RepID=UPI00216EE1FC|nr:HAMP domain-containing sensor histidine kinase [Aestuariivita sp.]MCE8006859.1 HAMP domain-containing histidine kinase [Aestuariivita sp.]
MIGRWKTIAQTPCARLGMRWQVTLLLILTQLAAHVTTILIVSPTIRSDERQQAFVMELAEPLLLILPLVAPDARSSDDMLQTIVSSDARFTLRDTVPEEFNPSLNLTRDTLVAAMSAHWGNRLSVFPADWSDRRKGPIAEPFSVAVDLTDGRQLVFNPTISPLAAAVPRVVLTLGLMLIAMPIMILSVWAGLAIIRPIGLLADGADAFTLDINAAPIRVHGGPEVRRATRSVNAMRDRIRKLLTDRSLTLVAISHDMRTPLTRMRLRLETIEAPGVDAVKRDLGELERMTDDALRFLRAEAEQADMRHTDLAVLCRTVCDEFADEGADVSYNGPDHLVAECDPALMWRVLLNILGNAVHYAGAGKVTLTGRSEDDASFVQIDVADNGPGIDPDQFAVVLQPFSRPEAVKAGLQGSPGGFGLGLAIAKQLMHRQGGMLSLKANTPGGLIVRLHLPASGSKT